MTPVEALASGKPVIALGRGGALETVPAFGGAFFDAPSGESLARAVRAFEMREEEFDPAVLQSHARQFRPAAFSRKMASVLAQVRERPRAFEALSTPAASRKNSGLLTDAGIMRDRRPRRRLRNECTQHPNFRRHFVGNIPLRKERSSISTERGRLCVRSGGSQAKNLWIFASPGTPRPCRWDSRNGRNRGLWQGRFH